MGESRRTVPMAKAWPADALAKRVFLLAMAGIAVEIVALIYLGLF
jgi:hypothetical protein